MPISRNFRFRVLLAVFGFQSQEYLMTIDRTTGDACVASTFDVGDHGVVVRDNVGTAQRWKVRLSCDHSGIMN